MVVFEKVGFLSIRISLLFQITWPQSFQMQTFLEIQTTIAKVRNKIEEGLGILLYHNCI